jgi:hypothetical protein
MSKFKIVPLSEEYAAGIRQNKTDDFGHTIIEQVATGKGPCRVSLKPFVKGQDIRILFSHRPFVIDNAYNQSGPVFINKDPVKAYDDIHRFPPELKADKKSFPLSLIGYSSSQMMVFTQLVGENDVDEMIDAIFDNNPGVAYLHARNAQAGCFICKIERAEGQLIDPALLKSESASFF